MCAAISLIGVDGGGSSSTGVLLDGNGNVLHHITTSATNPHTCGGEAAVTTLIDLSRQLSNASPLQVAAATFAISGLTPVLMKKLHDSLTLENILPSSTKVLIVHDSAAPLGLISDHVGLKPSPDQVEDNEDKVGAGSNIRKQYITLIAGTGSVGTAFEVGPSGGLGVNELNRKDVIASGPGCHIVEIGRVGGWGPLVGDEGSAYAIARQAVANALVELDNLGGDKGEATQVLRAAAAVLMGAGEEDDARECANKVVTAVHAGESGRAGLAGLAPAFAELAEMGNMICSKAFGTAAMKQMDLLRSISSSVKNSEGDETVLDVIVVGGVFEAWGIVKELRDNWQKDLPHLQKVGLKIHRLRERRDIAVAFGAGRLGAMVNGNDGRELKKRASLYIDHM